MSEVEHDRRSGGRDWNRDYAVLVGDVRLADWPVPPEPSAAERAARRDAHETALAHLHELLPEFGIRPALEPAERHGAERLVHLIGAAALAITVALIVAWSATALCGPAVSALVRTFAG